MQQVRSSKSNNDGGREKERGDCSSVFVRASWLIVGPFQPRRGTHFSFLAALAMALYRLAHVSMRAKRALRSARDKGHYRIRTTAFRNRRRRPTVLCSPLQASVAL